MEDKIRKIVGKRMIIRYPSYQEAIKATDETVAEILQLISNPMEFNKIKIQTTQVEEAFKNFVEYCEFNDLNKLVDKRDSTGNWYDLRELVTEWLSK